MRIFELALGWTLAHSLWQGAVVALLLAIVLGLARSSRVRYVAACMAMVAVLAWFGVTLWRLMPERIPTVADAPAISNAIVSLGDSGFIVNRATTWQTSDLMRWIAVLWIAGMALFQIRCVVSWMLAGRLRKVGICGAREEWVARLSELKSRLRMTRPVLLLESSLAEVPVVIGHLRPAIVVPLGLLTGLPLDQMEAILLHELAHIQRADYLVNLVQTFLEGLLFYHPAAWWISRVIRAERENCCDDLVVATQGDAHVYASALAALAENRWNVQQAAIAATGGNLVKRIQRLLGQQGPRSAMAPVLSAMVLILTGALALAAWQSPIPTAPTAQQKEALERVDKMLKDLDPALKSADEALKAADHALVQVRNLDTMEQALAQVHKVLKQIDQRGYFMQAAQGGSRKWLDEEVVYIITKEEREAFVSLRTDDERRNFINQFWERRDPTPGTPQNEYKDEHYRRLAYVNDRFTAKTMAGWRTDRGRIYILYGPPDEMESHPAGGKYTRPPSEGGGETNTYPFEQWKYKWIEGIGTKIIMEFVDKDGTGEYKMTTDPHARDAAALVEASPKSGPLPLKVSVEYFPITQASTSAQITIQFDTKDLHFENKDNVSAAKVNIYGRVATIAGRPLSPFEDVVSVSRPTYEIQRDIRENAHRIYQRTLPLAPGRYRLNIAAKELVGGNTGTWETILEVPESPAKEARFSSNGAEIVVGADKTARITLPIDYEASEFSARVNPFPEPAQESPLPALGKALIRIQHAALTDPCFETPEGSGCRHAYTKTIPIGPLPAGSYVFSAEVKDSGARTEKDYVVNFTVK